MAGVTTRDHSQFYQENNITNIHGASEIASERERQKLVGSLVFLVGCIAIFGLIGLSRLLHHDPGVEKWMDVSTTLSTLVPDAKTEYDRSSYERKYLENEFETIRKKLSFKAQVFNAISPEDQSLMDDLQHRMDAARENQKRQYNYIVRFLTTILQSRTLIAKGFRYNQGKPEWNCPPSDYWKYLQLTGDLTDTSLRITGGLSGQVHLVQVKFGKPLGAGPDQLCEASDDGTSGQ
jgi:hypothetical protein